MKVLSIAVIALLSTNARHHGAQSLASIIDADSFDEVPDTVTSTALLPGDAAEPLNQVVISPEMEQIYSIAKQQEIANKDFADYESRLSKINRFDGTFHAPDGHREFHDGTVVSGVNNFFARQRSADEFSMESDGSAVITDTMNDRAKVDASNI